MMATRIGLLAWATATLAVAQSPQAPAPGAATATGFATVVPEQVQPRCFAGPKSPLYEDVLVKGQVVRVGERSGDFVRVMLPLGVTGYVHKSFASEPADGQITTTANNVSFRYRPQSSEVPAFVLPKTSMLMMLGESDDWWRVYCADAPAYLAVSDVQAADAADAAAETGWGDLEKQRLAGWTDAVAKRDQSLAAAAALAQQRRSLESLAEKFRTESQKAIDEQDFAGVEQELGELLPQLAEGSNERARAEQIGQEVNRQRLLARAVKAVNDVPPTDATVVVPPPETKDPLAAFDAVGWLHYHRSHRGQDTVTLEKGGKLLFQVVCNSGRYDLGMYDNVEVGIKGAKAQRASDEVRELDVLKIEVLQLGR